MQRGRPGRYRYFLSSCSSAHFSIEKSSGASTGLHQSQAQPGGHIRSSLWSGLSSPAGMPNGMWRGCSGASAHMDAAAPPSSAGFLLFFFLLVLFFGASAIFSFSSSFFSSKLFNSSSSPLFSFSGSGSKPGEDRPPSPEPELES